MVLGSAVHASLAVYHSALMHGTTLPFTRLETSFHDSWQAQSDNTKVEYSSKQKQNDLQELGLNMIRQYTAQEPPGNIRSVEKPLYVPLHTSTGYILEKPLLAIADLITESSESLIVNEFKTSSRAYSGMEVDQSLQASCYIHAVEESWGEPATVRFIVFVKTKQPRIQQLDTVRDTDNSTRLGDIVQNIERAIRIDAFYPVESPLIC